MGIFGCSKKIVKRHEDAQFEVPTCVDWGCWRRIEGHVRSWSDNEVYILSAGKEQHWLVWCQYYVENECSHAWECELVWN